MTTDILLTINTPAGDIWVAIAIKPASKLDDKRVIEKLEIERRYWTDHKHVRWFLVTDFDLPTQRIRTLRWLKEMYSLEHLSVPYPEYWPDRCHRFIDQLKQAREMTIKQLTRALEDSGAFGEGDVITVIRHLAATKKILIDVNEEFDVNNSIKCIRLIEPYEQRKSA